MNLWWSWDDNVQKNESDLHKLDVLQTYCKNTPGLLIVTCWFCSSFQLLMIPLIMSVLYIWAQFNKDTVVSFWFGTQFKVRPSNVDCSILLSGSRFTEISERIKYTYGSSTNDVTVTVYANSA